jgi:hypothetical protein
MSELKDAIKNILSKTGSKAKEGIESILYSKVDDRLKTKKMETSANWLNGIEAPDENETNN